MKKWVWLGLVLVVVLIVVAVGFFATAHVRDLVGIDHVGLGSDFDGSTTTGFDASQVAVVTQALMDAGFSPDDIRKVMGGNVLRLLRADIAPSRG
ncbi:membrane dipeptidase [Bradyrhizobium sp. NP1]|uniref:membrane dipeptidase n=1 Tax=Bradyrhizobium sp. NP1 TaxID=3049772 RepID=UPI0025A66C5D|nr:membrane dipeptidase [Bradyrhizobium sp. NP1]WJR76317.1 membrane dipeptidase [Bradyrhizobium sp. NP1]